MPKSTGDFINDIAAKAGIAKDNEHLIAFLASDADLFNKHKIPDELVSAIENSLLSLDQAKNNHPEIHKHYYRSILDGLDADLNDVMAELQVPDNVKAEVNAQRSSFRRATLLPKKIKELEAAKKNTDDKGEKVAYQTQINELQGKLASETKKIDEVRSEYENKIKDIHKRVKLNDMFASYKTVYDDLPIEAKNTAIEALINKTLQDKSAEFQFGDDGQFKLIRKDGTNVVGDDHRYWTPQTLIDFTLSQNKLLKVSPDSKTAGNSANTGNTSDVVIAGTNGNGVDPNAPKKDHTLKNLAAQSLKDLENASKTTSVM